MFDFKNLPEKIKLNNNSVKLNFRFQITRSDESKERERKIHE